MEVCDGAGEADPANTQSNTPSSDELSIRETTLNTLVDSPLYAGVHFARNDLSPTSTDIVHLDVFADKGRWT